MVNVFKSLPVNCVIRISYKKEDGTVDAYTVRLNPPGDGTRKWGTHLLGCCVVLHANGTAYINCNLIGKNAEAAEGIRDFKINQILDFTLCASDNQELSLPDQTAPNSVVTIRNTEGEVEHVIGPFTEEDAISWAQMQSEENPNTDFSACILTPSEDFASVLANGDPDEDDEDEEIDE